MMDQDQRNLRVQSATNCPETLMMQRSMLRFILMDSVSSARHVTKHSSLEILSRLKSHVSFMHNSGKQRKNLLRDAGAIKQEDTSFKLNNHAMDLGNMPSEISISKLASN